jgi:hypothetical protein
MELVPSKRFDRILPVVAPMCLLLAASARYLPRHELLKQPIGRVAILLPMLGILFAGGYTWHQVSRNYSEHADVLVKFGEQVKAEVQGQGDRLAVVNGKDEGMLMYTGALRFTRLDDAINTWRWKRIDWLVLGEHDFNENRDVLGKYDLISQTPPVADKYNSYRLLRRVNPAPHPPPISTAKGEAPLPPSVRTAPPTGAPPWQPPTKLE